MTAFTTYTRDQLRLSYADAWRKRHTGAPLSPLEALIADVIELHPEYQALVRDSASTLDYQPDAAGTNENPFLHMGLHLAVREQVSIDRPPGVRELCRRLEARYGDAHRAEHAMMQDLADILYESQRTGTAPDEAQYMARVRARLGGDRRG
jgi:hypothetical protein